MLARLGPPAIVLALALAVRLAPWGEVFAPGGVRLAGDSDPHYHVLLAERWLAGAPGAPWTDPRLDWPHGASVPWPPLFDALVAGVAWLSAGPAADRDTIARVAAWLPPLLGLLLVALVARLGARILGRGGWVAALLVAILPAASELGVLGRVDQHALELVLFCAILLAFLRAVGPGARPLRAGAALALLAPVAFWTWMGSAVHLAVPLLAAAALCLLREDEAGEGGLAALAVGGLGGGLLLAASVALLGPPGALARTAATGVGGLHVALLLAAGAFASLALLRLRAEGARGAAARAAALGLAAALPGAALLALPGLRAGALRGLEALAAGNPWYAAIDEFEPLLHIGVAPLGVAAGALLAGYGLAHAAAAAGAVPLLAAWREVPGRRPEIVVLLVALALFVPAALLRKRFGGYALVPLAVAAEAGLRWAGSEAGRRWPALAPRARAVLWAGALAVASPALPEHLAPQGTVGQAEEEALRFAGSLPATPGRECVLAPWSLGHLVQYLADRPVVTSPFGTEGGERPMEDAAAFWLATSEERALSLLALRRCGLVLLADVVPEVDVLHGFAAPGTPAPLVHERGLLAGEITRDTEHFWRLVPVRLYWEDGLSTATGLPALTAFRLLHETPPTSPENPARERQWKIFQPVAGAEVEVRAAPGQAVRASVPLVTNAGRALEWGLEVTAGPGGAASFRLPYASGENGAVRAGPWTLAAGDRSAVLVVHEADVRSGARFRVDLASGRIERETASRP